MNKSLAGFGGPSDFGAVVVMEAAVFAGMGIDFRGYWAVNFTIRRRVLDESFPPHGQNKFLVSDLVKKS